MQQTLLCRRRSTLLQASNFEFRGVGKNNYGCRFVYSMVLRIAALCMEKNECVIQKAARHKTKEVLKEPA